MSDSVMRLGLNEARDAILLYDAGASALPMLVHTPRDIVGHADIKCAVLAAGEDIDPIAHLFAVPLMGPGNKSRDDIGKRVKA